jgi:hypothetical protein
MTQIDHFYLRHIAQGVLGKVSSDQGKPSWHYNGTMLVTVSPTSFFNDTDSFLSIEYRFSESPIAYC